VVALPAGSRQLFRQIQNWDKEYREYGGNYHDLQMDTCAEQVAADILNWLERHLNNRPFWCPLGSFPPSLADQNQLQTGQILAPS
jgi:hypothetical protein